MGDGEEVVTAGAAAVETEVAAEGCDCCVGSGGDWFNARGGLDSGDDRDGGGCGENCRTRIGGVPLGGCCGCCWEEEHSECWVMINTSYFSQ